MLKELNYQIINRTELDQTTLYSLNTERTYVISHPDSRKLLCTPEIVGYQIPELLLSPIAHALAYFSHKGDVENVNVVNILRGGLNFPIEAACSINDIKVKGVSFLTSERVFLEKKVARIESKYRKIHSINNATIIIGDIIASGDTLNNTIHYIEESYILAEKELKNIIVFTIGTDNALKAIKELNRILKDRWCKFEGISVVFVEGIFTAYPNIGITGLNLPGVDFSPNGGLLAPEYRSSLMDDYHIVLEKCVIYDGGARRFEQSDHISCILDYWRSLAINASHIQIRDLLEEKYGYCVPLPFEQWKRINYYGGLDVGKLEMLYKTEQDFFWRFLQVSLLQVAESRFSWLKDYYSDFIDFS